MSKHNPHDAEVVDQFTRQAEGYTRLINATSNTRARPLWTLLSVSPDDVVLDVACGPGTLALDLAPQVQSVTGIDLTPAMLEQARVQQLERRLSNISWHLANAEAIPFADSSFSLVVCRAAFHHLQDPQRVFAEMVRVCRSGGRLAVIDVAPSADKVAAYDAVEKQRDPSHVHAHTEQGLRALGDRAPVHSPVLQVSMTPHLSLDAVLATSHPVHYTIADIRAVFEADAHSQENRLGVDARFLNGELCVSYPMATALWVKR